MAKAAKTVHLQEFADDHGVTIRTVTNWLAEGMPHRTLRGERRVVRKEGNAWLIERARRKVLEKETDRLWDKDVEQAKKTAVDRQLRELELSKRLGELMPIGDLEEFADRLVGAFAGVCAGELQAFERRMGLEPDVARRLTMEMQEALMRGARAVADALEAEADEIEAAADEGPPDDAGEAADEVDHPPMYETGDMEVEDA